MILELTDHAFTQSSRRSLRVLQRIRDTKLVPLRSTKLVESEHIDMLHGITERLTDLSNVLNVVLGVSQTGYQYETNPDLNVMLGQTLAEINGRLQNAAGYLLIGFLITGFDVKQAQIDVIKLLIGVIGTKKA